MQGIADKAPGIVIVGAGQAGARAAEAARGAGFSGRITLIGAEPHLPYERPQLSKATLIEDGAPIVSIRDGAGWAALGVEVVAGTRIAGGDAAGRTVTAEDGRVFPYDALLIATGTAPRRLPVLETGALPVLALRSVEDALALRRHLAPGARIAIVGGGVIGLEVAAAAAKAGAAATVIEAAPSLLARALPAPVAAFLKARHETAGVTFRLGRVPVGLSPEGVALADGEVVPADAVVVGIGVEPELELARSLGLAVDQGILVDDCGRTSVPGVFAAGDVASRACPWLGRVARTETWANAQNQAAAAARTMVGQDTAYGDPPWFWTDQYELNIQVVGNAAAGDIVLRGDPAAGRFTAIALAGGIVAGAVTVNTPKDMAALRRLVAGRRSLAADEAGDPGFDLRKAATR
ncbi:NAD(P)/FAD-dependent oxidoreductase [Zavarzinia compransoris]|uniref:Pyridine nucleotide-disulfide oxidoreductase n=1 Tax=Zavarzinia compransoris TaxID=1264899 RepID=A0A317E1W5_9PROT|nr:FAD-dependent oxidoreductase [Zavarzinia compransoris]PWR20959.1 hypothetical protein DKG75_13290 [Zavarzinia compransoris]TDP43987.1 p-cumate 2,3-dioxygenase ferredoxin reductase subunit/anthranilate 1,2-dioxygenase ferredoxin reductase subunit [Zavarzinia compransoris]